MLSNALGRETGGIRPTGALIPSEAIIPRPTWLSSAGATRASGPRLARANNTRKPGTNAKREKCLATGKPAGSPRRPGGSSMWKPRVRPTRPSPPRGRPRPSSMASGFPRPFSAFGGTGFPARRRHSGFGASATLARRRPVPHAGHGRPAENLGGPAHSTGTWWHRLSSLWRTDAGRGPPAEAPAEAGGPAYNGHDVSCPYNPSFLQPIEFLLVAQAFQPVQRPEDVGLENPNHKSQAPDKNQIPSPQSQTRDSRGAASDGLLFWIWCLFVI